MNLVSTSSIRNYLERLPVSLKIIIKARLWTAIGSGGVLYLSPIIFNNLGFSAEQIGSGITTAAFAGITTRIVTGYLLDKKYSYTKTIKVACLIAIISDYVLLNSESYLAYLLGQFFLGAAAGIYWPSIELAVPLSCNNKVNSNEAYPLARSADAIGVTLGVLTGTIGTYFGSPRVIYIIDIICMAYIFYMLKCNTEGSTNRSNLKISNKAENTKKRPFKLLNFNWILELAPLLSLTLFVTGVMSLIQTILPLDLVNGGVIRPPFIEQRVASLLTFKLILIAILQWPVGYFIRHKTSSFKFKLCLLLLLIGFILLSLSNFLFNGHITIIIAFIPLSIALCIFLPSASDAIIKSSPKEYRGSAIALYSQCFGISSLTIPWLAGKLIDNYNTAIQVWLIVSLACLFLIPICKKIK